MGAEDVLVIDDNETTRDSLKMLLESEGYDVSCSADKRLALEFSEEKKFAIFLIDFRMPGINGAELTLLLREFYPNAFIVGISFDHKESEFLLAGADAFVSKADLSTKLVQLRSRLLKPAE
jgi:CheY-like chemotaxis protein